MLDEALDFRGNFLFGAVSACCAGCAAWQRCFILLPRWALTMACASLVSATALSTSLSLTALSSSHDACLVMQVSTYCPWAFRQNLTDLGSAGGAPSARQLQLLHSIAHHLQC
jgi:hypothetical protein